MESFKWHQPNLDGPPPTQQAAAAALVSLAPGVPPPPVATRVHNGQAQQQQQQQQQNNNQDVINLQYMDLEEFLLENAVAVVPPNQQQMEHKGTDRVICLPPPSGHYIATQFMLRRSYAI